MSSECTAGAPKGPGEPNRASVDSLPPPPIPLCLQDSTGYAGLDLMLELSWSPGQDWLSLQACPRAGRGGLCGALSPARGPSEAS